MSQNDPAGLAHAKKLIRECLETKAPFLDLGNCGLRDLSELPELWDCQHLEGLLMGYGIYEEGLFKQTENFFSTNKIGSLGSIIISEKLPRLKLLDLSFNDIKDEGLRALSRNMEVLRSFNLSSNQITGSGINSLVKHLKHLNNLDVSYCRITEGVKFLIENLINLNTLDLSGITIGESEAFAIGDSLPNINYLWINQTSINENGVIYIAKNCNFIKTLGIGGNKISINAAIEIVKNSVQLNSLDLNFHELGDNGAIEIAPFCEYLTSLNLSGQPFDTGSNQIGTKGIKAISKYCKNLKFLDISWNKVDNKGAKLIAENLKSLTYLDLGMNQISFAGVGSIVKNLTALINLDLGSNKIGDKGASLVVENCKNLTSLNLSDNNISDLGAKIIANNFNNLIDLNLSKNKITDFTPFIQILKKEPHLPIIFNNEIMNKGINLTNNNFTNLPIEKFLQGRDAIISHFENREKEKIVNLAPYINKEVKLIIAGNSNAGKSTLVKYLMEKIVDKDLPSTHWMEVKNWSNPFPDNPKIENIRIFDFGGQEYYHDTHYMFFTSNTSYLMLWDVESNGLSEIEIKQRSPFKDEVIKMRIQCFPIEYWLDAISFFAKKNTPTPNIPIKLRNSDGPMISITKKNIDNGSYFLDLIEHKANNISKVLLVQNKLDTGAPAKLPLDQYEKNQSNIEIYDSISMSVINNRYLESLKYSINDMINSLNIIGKPFEGTYGIVREHFITFSGEISTDINSFKNLCNKWIKEAGDKANKNYANLFFDDQQTKYCAQTFSWLGYILYFPNSERISNKVFLNQTKITDSIYKILFDLGSAFGEINEDTIRSKTGFKKNEVEDIIGLMQEFKIIFKHPDSTKEDTYIAPLYLPGQPTKGISFFLSSLQKPVYRIQYSGFIHKSIILEFFQEYGQYVLKESNISHEDVFYYWRNGIVVKKAIANRKEGLVLVQFFNGEDTLDASGKIERIPARIDIFSLKDGSDELSEEIRNKLEEINEGWKVTEMVTADGTLFVPLSEIHKNEEKKQYIFKYGEDYFELIHFKQYLKNTYPMKKLFISYSKSDEHYRNELEKHLSVLKRNGHIATWHDRRLLPGEKWDGKIRQELKEADIILFLVSADFLATDYIWDVEIGTALDRDKDPNDRVSVVPIILRKCDWMDSPLGKFNSPVKGKDISTAPDKDEAIYEIVKELKELIKS